MLPVRNSVTFACIVAVILQSGHPFLQVVCKCDLSFLSAEAAENFCHRRASGRQNWRLGV